MKDISTINNKYPWLVFNLNRSFFALNCENITSITILPKKITEPVMTPPHIRGLLDIRGEVIPLADMRELFGFPSMGTEFDELKSVINHGACLEYPKMQ
jgi:chemotaxis signal transduction protein